MVSNTHWSCWRLKPLNMWRSTAKLTRAKNVDLFADVYLLRSVLDDFFVSRLYWEMYFGPTK